MVDVHFAEAACHQLTKFQALDRGAGWCDLEGSLPESFRLNVFLGIFKGRQSVGKGSQTD